MAVSVIPTSQASAGDDQEYPSEIVFRFVAACTMTIEQKSGPYDDGLPIKICSCILDKTREEMSFVEFRSKPESTKELFVSIQRDVLLHSGGSTILCDLKQGLQAEQPGVT